jgi:hypothetical protein
MNTLFTTKNGWVITDYDERNFSVAKVIDFPSGETRLDHIFYYGCLANAISKLITLSLKEDKVILSEYLKEYKKMLSDIDRQYKIYKFTEATTS